ncbi:TPA: PerC family transcriptional regulator [Escherichia coli]|nr:PerC family transcriptional regulator [Escherichia coli]
MVHDRIAEELEAKGFYRRAAARWGEVLVNVETDKEREEAARRRAICITKCRRMPEQFVAFGDVKRAADRTLKEMGINAQAEVWRNYNAGDEDDGLPLM